MDRKVTLKIIMDDRKSQVAEHAQRAVRAINQHAFDTKHIGNIEPQGMPSHRARFAVACDDCGQTYWPFDPYAAHMGCKGAPANSALGFQR